MPAVIPTEAIPRDVHTIARVLRDSGHSVWVVGGSLRDQLLGRSVSDWDLATTAKPDEMMKLFRRAIPTGLAHGTVSVLLSGRTYEVTTLRGEGAYSDGRHPDSVHFVGDIEQDLERRDFTVNAMAYDPFTDTLVDPFDGRADLDARVLRAVREPLVRFREDGLRVLRACRFVASLEFALDPATREAIEPSLDVLAKVSRERMRDELVKTMKARRPSLAFTIMRETGVLRVVAPALAEVPDASYAGALVAMDAADGVVVRHAALLSCLGGGDVAAAEARKLLAALRYSRDEQNGIASLVGLSSPAIDPALARPAFRAFIRRVGRDALAPYVALVAALRGTDEAARLRARLDEELAAGVAFSPKDLRIGGDEVAALVGKPGPRIREVLDALLAEVDGDPALNDPAWLRARAKALVEAGT